MFNKNNFDKLIPVVGAIAITLIGVFAGYYLHETSAETELKIASVNYEISYELIHDNQTELAVIMPMVTLYNTKRSDYPARLFPEKNQIIDCENREIISEIPSGLDKSIVLPGESVEMYRVTLT